MIVVTFKGSPPPLLGRVRGLNVVSDQPGPSAAAALAHAMNRFRNETEGFLFVAPGARIHSARVWPVTRRQDFDCAAHVDRIGRTPAAPGRFDGIGRVSVETLLIRPTEAGKRLLTRWRERNAVRPGNEAVELAIALVETTPALLELPKTWVWREAEARAVDPLAAPVVEYALVGPQGPRAVPPSPTAPPRLPALGPGVTMASSFYGYTGYGNLARQILFRVANSMTVRLDDPHHEAVTVDEGLRARLDAHRSALVAPKTPSLFMKGPERIAQVGWRGILTMQETSVRVHPDMVDRINASFSELWTPSHWNLQVFRDSGVRIPARVVRLGVNPEVFRPDSGHPPLPPCRLISTGRAGAVESPKGFLFLTVGVPGRKGWGVIADALDLAFAGTRKKVALVVGLTHAPPSVVQKVCSQLGRHKIPIWTLEGSFSEHELARIYASCDAYVSASHGEGFNLPVVEAAACGLPVIVPNNTVHPELFCPQAFSFDGDGERPAPQFDSMSDWYRGMPFAHFGRRSIRRLAELLEIVQRAGPGVADRAAALRARVLAEYTWDRTAVEVTRRLLEVQP